MDIDDKHGDSNNDSADKNQNIPTPDNFIKFFPWACKRLNLEDIVTITNIQSSFISPTAKQKNKKQKSTQHPLQSAETVSDMVSFKLSDNNINNINITTVCDDNGDILQLKFDKNNKIPRIIFKILAVILEYHACLKSISINKGLDGGVLYELEKLTKLNITDLCLDGTRVESANYEFLLETENNLKNLSIARCDIDDDMVKKIAEKLTYNLPASETLALLNLTSNKITDEGAKYLANALRSNRCLVYLNLSDNRITDVGMFAILDVLDQFKLLADEIKTCRMQRLQYLKENQNQVQNIQKSMTTPGKLSAKQIQEPKSGKKQTKTEYKQEVNKNTTSEYLDDMFSNAFSKRNTILIDGQKYCLGNNNLAYLNISYNNVSYLTVKRLLEVIKNQRLLDRKPVGLVHFAIEGNDIPSGCPELIEITNILLPMNPAASKLRKKSEYVFKPGRPSIFSR